MVAATPLRPTQPCNRLEPNADVYEDAAQPGPVTVRSVDLIVVPTAWSGVILVRRDAGKGPNVLTPTRRVERAVLDLRGPAGG